MSSHSVHAVDCQTPDGDTLALSGALTFATATRAYEDANAALERGARTRLDLSGLTRTDSAGLACVLALLAEASRARRPLRISNIPDSLRALAEVCDAREFLRT
ncbi:MAG TPA: STAS domain-containing protein [Rhodanobacteraceae bacterium]|nr:STAS domain-containing protein [Rhodanobacteraceae bacterium]